MNAEPSNPMGTGHLEWPEERDAMEAAWVPGPLALASMARVAWERRSSLAIDHDREVPLSLLERLCTVASWAPNHKRTRPWRFCIVTGPGREALGAAVADDLAEQGAPPARIARARAKYLRAPATLVVAAQHSEEPTRRAEDRDAVAAATGLLVLAATAAGLRTLWSTGDAAASAALRRVCGLQPSDAVVAIVYIGWPAGDPPPAPRRDAPVISYLGRSDDR